MCLATAACYDDIEIFDLGGITVDGDIKNRGSLEIYPRSNLVGTRSWCLPHTKCSWHKTLLSARIYNKNDSWELYLTYTLNVSLSHGLFLFYTLSLLEVLLNTKMHLK